MGDLLAELAPDSAIASDLVWKVYEAGELPDASIVVASSVWNNAGRPERSIEAIEAHLRRGQPADAALRHELSVAYAASGRMNDARRAGLQD